MTVVGRAVTEAAGGAGGASGAALPSWLGLVVLVVVLAVALFVALRRRGGPWRRPRIPLEDEQRIRQEGRVWGGPPGG